MKGIREDIQYPIIIGIAGGTGSGKSTFTNRLKSIFRDQVTVLYYDNYYRAHDDIPFEERQKINYDHPDAFETDLLLEHLKELKEGKTIQCPVYDYTKHNRSDKVVEVKPSKIILLEGILVLSDTRLRDMMDYKIFVEADADERILRRVLRDVKERGRDIENIVNQYLSTVKPMHYLYVEPTKMYADIVINSGMNDRALDVMATKINHLLENTNEESEA
ncbi:MAG: uridine kinase [Lachnospiraceae bacterium]|jgi:uridine kinase|nr:uridine kinase [Lachnospiraceae bacterium]MBQ5376198.1 uridine kinase [Lachnospiraceae bacterium]MBR1847676.1 uridine kinase [Lachnospiraceae bacterium]